MQTDDAAIIRRVRSGERDAYAELVRQYHARVIGLCRSLLGNTHDAEDAAQEAFFKAYEALDSFRENASFYTWIYRIASNYCLSLLRTKARRPSQSLDALLETKKAELTRFFAAVPDPRSAFEARELLDKVLSAIRPNYRLVLTLREQDGLSYEEIAAVTESSVDSVKAQLRRARDEAQEKLRHFLPAEGV